MWYFFSDICVVDRSTESVQKKGGKSPDQFDADEQRGDRRPTNPMFRLCWLELEQRLPDTAESAEGSAALMCNAITVSGLRHH